MALCDLAPAYLCHISEPSVPQLHLPVLCHSQLPLPHLSVPSAWSILHILSSALVPPASLGPLLFPPLDFCFSFIALHSANIF